MYAIIASLGRYVQVDGNVRHGETFQHLTSKLLIIAITFLRNVAILQVLLGEHAIAENGAVEDDTIICRIALVPRSPDMRK